LGVKVKELDFGGGIGLIIQAKNRGDRPLGGQPQHKGGAFKGLARSHCLNCMDEQEYYLTVPVNRKETLKAVMPKADALT